MVSRNCHFLILVLLTLVSCARKDPVVARIGDETITLREFRAGYLNVIKQPDAFDSPKLREQFLDELIIRRLLAREAVAQHLDQDEKLALRIEAFQDRCIREAHFDWVIRPDIDVTDAEVEEVFAYNQEERRIRHLFLPTRQQADSVHALLENGASFEDLAFDLFDGPMRDSRGDLGWVHWDQMEFDMAMAAFRQDVGDYSHSVKSSYGYHLIQVTDYKRVPLSSETRYQRSRDDIRYLVETKAGEKIASSHVNRMMDEAELKVRPQVLGAVREQVKAIVKRKPNQFDAMRPQQLSEEEMGKMERSLWEMRQAIVAEIDGEPLTVARFVGHLNYVPYEVLYSSFKSATDYVLRDALLTREGKKMGLDGHPDVELKTRLFSDYLLSLALRRQLVQKAAIDETSMKAYYEAHKSSRFHDADYETVRKNIARELKREARMKAVPDYVGKLRNSTSVIKELKPIHDYYDSIGTQH